MKNFGRFTYYGNLAGYSHFWSTTDPPNYGARIGLNEAGSTYIAFRGEEHPEPTKEEIAEARALVASKDFGRFKYRGKSGKAEHLWSTGSISGARIALNKDGSIHHISEDPKPTEAEITEARAKIGIEEAQVRQSNWDFGRFKYRGKSEIPNSYMPIESRHTWSTAQGSKIGLREDGSLAFTCETHGLENPTAFEISKAQALVKHTVFEETDAYGEDVRTQTHVLRGSQPNVQKLCSEDSRQETATECAPCNAYWYPPVYGPWLGEPCPHCGQPVTSFIISRDIPKVPKFSGFGDFQGSSLIKSFGRFIYFGKFMHIVHKPGDPRNEVEPNHLWATSDPPWLADARISLKEDGELLSEYPVVCRKPATPEEIGTARNMVLSLTQSSSSPNIQRMRRTPRERTKIPDFSRLGSVVGSPLIHPSPQNFGRFIYHRNLGTDHFWTTDPDSTDIAYISVNPDGTLNQSGSRGAGFKAPTKEEIDTARNMVLSANLVKQVEEGERPVIRSTAFYRNKEKTEDPPFNQLSRGLGTAVFHQLMNVLKPKESKPVERFQIDPGPVYRIKPHVLSLPLLDPSTHARHHCLYTERYDVFKITGLAMWGISEDTTLNISIGGQAVFDGDVPAQMFANGLSFHELYQILELKEPPDRIVSQTVSEDLITKLRTNVKWRALDEGLIPTLKIHENLELNISGLAKYAVFWGYRRDLIHD